MKKKGFFIVIDGPDGAGKSTQARLLADALSRAGKDVLLTREPGGTVIGERLRSVILDKTLTEMNTITELFLYLACRSQFVEEVVRPALKAGKVVISERYFWSTIAYQGYAGGLNPKEILRLCETATNKLYPNLSVFLDINAEAGLHRAGKRGAKDRMEEKGAAFHRKVASGFRSLAKSFPKKIRLLKADGTVEQVHEKIMRVVNDAL